MTHFTAFTAIPPVHTSTPSSGGGLAGSRYNADGTWAYSLGVRPKDTDIRAIGRLLKKGGGVAYVNLMCVMC